MYHAVINQKLAGLAILISGKVAFRAKKITRDRDKYYIMIEGPIHQENSKS